MQTFFKALRASSVLGAIGAITVLLFGGWSGAVMGWLLGTAAGYTSSHDGLSDPKTGAQVGAKAGLALGIWLAVASIVEGLILRPLTGRAALPLPQTVLYAAGGLAMAVVWATVMAVIQSIANPRQRQRMTWLLIALFLVIFPMVDQRAATGWIATVIQILIFAILALGLNIPVGYAGLLDLGYAAFFAIGAYTTGMLSSPHLGIEWNFWIVIWIAAAVAAIAGVILGAPTLPLRGDYLAIVTLGFGEIVPIVFRNLTDIRIVEPISSLFATLLNRPELAICLIGCEEPLNLTNGEAGINPIGRPWLPFIGTFRSDNYLPWYYLVLLLVVFSMFMINRLRLSRLGRAWAAIREDELAASSMGINRVNVKLLAFAMGATFSGFAGAFYGSYITAIFPSVFDFSVSVIILCMVILGGLGNMTGVLLGCVIIMAADRLYLPQLAQVLKGFLNTAVLPNVANPALRDFIAISFDPIQMRLFLFGLVLVVMMIVRPEGLVPNARRKAELRSEDPVANESLADVRSV
jgi:branched-chain amino acid transport system permease protein